MEHKIAHPDMNGSSKRGHRGDVVSRPGNHSTGYTWTKGNQTFNSAALSEHVDDNSTGNDKSKRGSDTVPAFVSISGVDKALTACISDTDLLQSCSSTAALPGADTACTDSKSQFCFELLKDLSEIEQTESGLPILTRCTANSYESNPSGSGNRDCLNYRCMPVLTPVSHADIDKRDEKVPHSEGLIAGSVSLELMSAVNSESAGLGCENKTRSALSVPVKQHTSGVVSAVQELLLNTDSTTQAGYGNNNNCVSEFISRSVQPLPPGGATEPGAISLVSPKLLTGGTLSVHSPAGNLSNASSSYAQVANTAVKQIFSYSQNENQSLSENDNLLPLHPPLLPPVEKLTEIQDKMTEENNVEKPPPTLSPPNLEISAFDFPTSCQCKKSDHTVCSPQCVLMVENAQILSAQGQLGSQTTLTNDRLCNTKPAKSFSDHNAQESHTGTSVDGGNQPVMDYSIPFRNADTHQVMADVPPYTADSADNSEFTTRGSVVRRSERCHLHVTGTPGAGADISTSYDKFCVEGSVCDIPTSPATLRVTTAHSAWTESDSVQSDTGTPVCDLICKHIPGAAENMNIHAIGDEIANNSASANLLPGETSGGVVSPQENNTRQMQTVCEQSLLDYKQATRSEKNTSSTSQQVSEMHTKHKDSILWTLQQECLKNSKLIGDTSNMSDDSLCDHSQGQGHQEKIAGLSGFTSRAANEIEVKVHDHGANKIEVKVCKGHELNHTDEQERSVHVSTGKKIQCQVVQSYDNDAMSDKGHCELIKNDILSNRDVIKTVGKPGQSLSESIIATECNLLKSVPYPDMHTEAHKDVHCGDVEKNPGRSMQASYQANVGDDNSSDEYTVTSIVVIERCEAKDGEQQILRDKNMQRYTDSEHSREFPENTCVLNKPDAQTEVLHRLDVSDVARQSNQVGARVGAQSSSDSDSVCMTAFNLARPTDFTQMEFDPNGHRGLNCRSVCCDGEEGVHIPNTDYPGPLLTLNTEPEYTHKNSVTGMSAVVQEELQGSATHDSLDLCAKVGDWSFYKTCSKIQNEPNYHKGTLTESTGNSRVSPICSNNRSALLCAEKKSECAHFNNQDQHRKTKGSEVRRTRRLNSCHKQNSSVKHKTSPLEIKPLRKPDRVRSIPTYCNDHNYYAQSSDLLSRCKICNQLSSLVSRDYDLLLKTPDNLWDKQLTVCLCTLNCYHNKKSQDINTCLNVSDPCSVKKTGRKNCSGSTNPKENMINSSGFETVKQVQYDEINKAMQRADTGETVVTDLCGPVQPQSSHVTGHVTSESQSAKSEHKHKPRKDTCVKKGQKYKPTGTNRKVESGTQRNKSRRTPRSKHKKVTLGVNKSHKQRHNKASAYPEKINKTRENRNIFDIYYETMDRLNIDSQWTVKANNVINSSADSEPGIDLDLGHMGSPYEGVSTNVLNTGTQSNSSMCTASQSGNSSMVTSGLTSGQTQNQFGSASLGICYRGGACFHLHKPSTTSFPDSTHSKCTVACFTGAQIPSQGEIDGPSDQPTGVIKKTASPQKCVLNNRATTASADGIDKNIDNPEGEKSQGSKVEDFTTRACPVSQDLRHASESTNIFNTQCEKSPELVPQENNNTQTSEGFLHQPELRDHKGEPGELNLNKSKQQGHLSVCDLLDKKPLGTDAELKKHTSGPISGHLCKSIACVSYLTSNVAVPAQWTGSTGSSGSVNGDLDCVVHGEQTRPIADEISAEFKCREGSINQSSKPPHQLGAGKSNPGASIDVTDLDSGQGCEARPELYASHTEAHMEYVASCKPPSELVAARESDQQKPAAVEKADSSAAGVSVLLKNNITQPWARNPISQGHMTDAVAVTDDKQVSAAAAGEEPPSQHLLQSSSNIKSSSIHSSGEPSTKWASVNTSGGFQNSIDFCEGNQSKLLKTETPGQQAVKDCMQHSLSSKTASVRAETTQDLYSDSCLTLDSKKPLLNVSKLKQALNGLSHCRKSRKITDITKTRRLSINLTPCDGDSKEPVEKIVSSELSEKTVTDRGCVTRRRAQSVCNPVAKFRKRKYTKHEYPASSVLISGQDRLEPEAATACEDKWLPDLVATGRKGTADESTGRSSSYTGGRKRSYSVSVCGGSQPSIVRPSLGFSVDNKTPKLSDKKTVKFFKTLRVSIEKLPETSWSSESLEFVDTKCVGVDDSESTQNVCVSDSYNVRRNQWLESIETLTPEQDGIGDSIDIFDDSTSVPIHFETELIMTPASIMDESQKEAEDSKNTSQPPLTGGVSDKSVKSDVDNCNKTVGTDDEEVMKDNKDKDDFDLPHLLNILNTAENKSETKIADAVVGSSSLLSEKICEKTKAPDKTSGSASSPKELLLQSPCSTTASVSTESGIESDIPSEQILTPDSFIELSIPAHKLFPYQKDSQSLNLNLLQSKTEQENGNKKENGGDERDKKGIDSVDGKSAALCSQQRSSVSQQLSLLLCGSDVEADDSKQAYLSERGDRSNANKTSLGAFEDTPDSLLSLMGLNPKSEPAVLKSNDKTQVESAPMLKRMLESDSNDLESDIFKGNDSKSSKDTLMKNLLNSPALNTDKGKKRPLGRPVKRGKRGRPRKIPDSGNALPRNKMPQGQLQNGGYQYMGEFQDSATTHPVNMMNMYGSPQMKHHMTNQAPNMMYQDAHLGDGALNMMDQQCGYQGPVDYNPSGPYPDQYMPYISQDHVRSNPAQPQYSNPTSSYRNSNGNTFENMQQQSNPPANPAAYIHSQYRRENCAAPTGEMPWRTPENLRFPSQGSNNWAHLNRQQAPGMNGYPSYNRPRHAYGQVQPMVKPGKNPQLQGPHPSNIQTGLGQAGSPCQSETAAYRKPQQMEITENTVMSSNSVSNNPLPNSMHPGIYSRRTMSGPGPGTPVAMETQKWGTDNSFGDNDVFSDGPQAGSHVGFYPAGSATRQERSHSVPGLNASDNQPKFPPVQGVNQEGPLPWDDIPNPINPAEISDLVGDAKGQSKMNWSMLLPIVQQMMKQGDGKSSPGCSTKQALPESLHMNKQTGNNSKTSCSAEYTQAVKNTLSLRDTKSESSPVSSANSPCRVTGPINVNHRSPWQPDNNNMLHDQPANSSTENQLLSSNKCKQADNADQRCSAYSRTFNNSQTTASLAQKGNDWFGLPQNVCGNISRAQAMHMSLQSGTVSFSKPTQGSLLNSQQNIGHMSPFQDRSGRSPAQAQARPPESIRGPFTSHMGSPGAPNQSHDSAWCTRAQYPKQENQDNLGSWLAASMGVNESVCACGEICQDEETYNRHIATCSLLAHY